MKRSSPVYLFLAIMLGGCVSLPDNSDRVESHAFTDTQDTLLGINIRAQQSQGMAEQLIAEMEKSAFRLGLKEDEDGNEYLLWHGYEDKKPVTFDVEPYTGFWVGSVSEL